jgi:hypothetical protein
MFSGKPWVEPDESREKNISRWFCPPDERFSSRTPRAIDLERRGLEAEAEAGEAGREGRRERDDFGEWVKAGCSIAPYPSPRAGAGPACLVVASSSVAAPAAADSSIGVCGRAVDDERAIASLIPIDVMGDKGALAKNSLASLISDVALATEGRLSPIGGLGWGCWARPSCICRRDRWPAMIVSSESPGRAIMLVGSGGGRSSISSEGRQSERARG